MTGDAPQGQDHVRDWAAGLNIPIGGETILFADCEAAFYRTSNTRATAQVLQQAGVEFGLMNEQWCCGGPAAEMGYVEQSRAFAEHNLADWRASGVKRVIAIEPHDYVHFTEDYPAYFGADFDIEVVQIVELVADLIREGRLQLTKPIEKTVTYHDPCRLNKRKNIHEAPRFILRSIPGLKFYDVDHVTQWSYCSGGGGGLPIEKPEITAEISRRRVARARELGVDMLVSACVWSERPLATAGNDAGIEVADIIELVAESRRDRRGWPPRRVRACRHRGDGMTVMSVDAAVVDDLEAILGEPGAVLTNISSRVNRARVPAPFPVHRWSEYTPAAVVLPRTAAQVLGDREACQPGADSVGAACRWYRSERRCSAVARRHRGGRQAHESDS